MAASDLQKRVSALPRELQQKIMYNAYPDLKTLRQQGHILVTEDRTVSLPSSMTVRVFLVGGGGGVIPSRFFVDQIEWGGGGSGHLTKGQLVVPDSGEISVKIGRSRRSRLGGFGHPSIVVAEKSLIAGGGEVRNGDGGSGWSGGGGNGIDQAEGGGRGGSNGGDGEAGTDYCYTSPGGRGSGAALPHIPGLTLAPGRPGEPRGGRGGGGGGVTVNGGPGRRDQHCGEGFGAGGCDNEGTSGVVIIYSDKQKG